MFYSDPFIHFIKSSIVIIIFCYLFEKFQHIANHIILLFKTINTHKITNMIKSLEQKYNTTIILFMDDPHNHHNNHPNILTIEDSIKFTKLLRNTKGHISIILHTNGGSVKSSDMIVQTILNSKQPCHAYIPYYAYSAGSMVALACDRIHMMTTSYLGPTDPQIECPHKKGSCTLPSKAFSSTDREYQNDIIHLLKHEATIYHLDNLRLLGTIFDGNVHKDQLLNLFGSGDYPHTRPLTVHELQNVGLDYIDTNIPKDFVELVDEII